MQAAMAEEPSFIRGGQSRTRWLHYLCQCHGPGPVINGAEAIGGGVDIQVRQNAVMQNGDSLKRLWLEMPLPGRHVRRRAYQSDQSTSQVLRTLKLVFCSQASFNVERGPESTGGGSGNIELDANSILIKESGLWRLTRIPSPRQGCFSSCDAGNIIVKANQNIELNGSSIGIC